jgi:hypothetical protein
MKSKFGFVFHCPASLLCVFALASPAHALTVVDTGAGPDYGGGATLYDQRPVSPNYQSLAGHFSFSEPSAVQSLAGWLNSNYPGQLTFAIAADAGGLPGQTLFSSTVDVVPTAINHPDWRGAIGLDWNLGAGDYWFVISATTDEPNYLGSMPEGPVAHPLDEYAVNYTYSTGFAPLSGAEFGMQINVSTVPEPGPIALLVAGAFLLVSASRLRDNR